jgi:hypothetical protein
MAPASPFPPSAICTAKQIADWLQIRPRQVARLFPTSKLVLGHRTVRFKAAVIIRALEQQRRKRRRKARR